MLDSTDGSEVELLIDPLDVDILPGGCTEPVIHWYAVMAVIELLRSSPAS